MNETDLRTEFERQHAGRRLDRHRLRGTYSSANIAALWNQHVRTTRWIEARFARVQTQNAELLLAVKALLPYVELQSQQDPGGWEDDAAWNCAMAICLAKGAIQGDE